MSKWSRIKDSISDAPGDLADIALNTALDTLNNVTRGASNTIAGRETASKVTLPEAVWNLAKPLIKPAANEIMDSTHPKEWWGDVNRGLAKIPNAEIGLRSLPLGMALQQTGMLPGSKEDIKRINSIDGSGRDVWESNQGEQNRLIRGVNDVLIDPTTYLTLGGSSAGAKTIAKGAEITSKGGKLARVGGEATKAAGYGMKILEAPDTIIDKAIAPVLGSIAKTKVGQYISGDSARSALRRSFNFGYVAANKLRKNIVGDTIGAEAAAKAIGDAGFTPGAVPSYDTEGILNVINNPIATPVPAKSSKANMPMAAGPNVATGPFVKTKGKEKFTVGKFTGDGGGWAVFDEAGIDVSVFADKGLATKYKDDLVSGKATVAVPSMAPVQSSVPSAVPLTDDEKLALKEYSSGYGPGRMKSIGKAAKNSEYAATAPGVEKRFPVLDSAIEKSTIGVDTTLWRGTRNLERDGITPVVGSEFTTNGYFSTSRTRASSESFASDALLEVKLPAGSKAVEVPSEYGEDETLLGRGVKFKVTSVREEEVYGRLKKVITVEPVSSAPPTPASPFLKTKGGGTPTPVQAMPTAHTGELPQAQKFTYSIDYSKIENRQFERGVFSGSDVHSEIPTMIKKSEDDIAFMKDATLKDAKGNPVKSGKIDPKKKKQFDELVDFYGGDLNELSDEDILRVNIDQMLKSDPTRPDLEPEENAWLWDNVFKQGDYKGASYGEALQDIADKYREDSALIRKELIGSEGWAPGQKYISDFEYLMTDPKAKKAFNYWSGVNVDPLNYEPEDAAFVILEREAYRDSGIETRMRQQQKTIKDKMWATIGDGVAVWKGVALLSPRYHGTNVMSNWLNVALTNGLSGLASPVTIVKSVINQFGEPGIHHQLASTQAVETLEDYGMVTLNRNIGSQGSSEMIGGTFDSAPKFFEDLFFLHRNTGRAIGRKIGAVIEVNRKISIGVDTAARVSLWDTAFRADIEQHIPEVTAKVLEQARLQGLDLPADVAPLPFRDPKKLLAYYRGIGFEDGRARRLSRNMAEQINKSEKLAQASVHKALFSYYKTPLDELIGKVIPFHYYASRATAMYAEEVLRSPFLMINLTRAINELADTDQAGLSARQKGWIKILSGPAGYTLIANPDALLGVSRTLGMMTGGGYSPEGETELGGVLRWMKAGGYGMYPWIDGIFNMTGAYGDTFEPDMLGIRHRALVGSIVNSIVAETGGGVPEPFYAGANAQARETISTWFAAFAPDWMSQPVKAKNNRSGSIAEATMDKAIESRIVSNNPGMTYAQLLEIMNDPESDEFKQAWTEVARSGLANQLMSFTIPVTTKFRDSKSDIRDAKVGVYYDLKEQGKSPMQDAEFAAQYKRLTGEDYKSGALDRALMEKDMVGATPKARVFIVSEYEYNKLGTKRAKEIKSTVNKIKYDGYVPPGYSVPVQGEESQLADQWLSSLPANDQSVYGEMLDIQSAFRSTHPEYGEYLDWRGQINYLVALVGDAGYSAYRSKVSEGNPNAKLYFDAKIANAKRLYPGKTKEAVEYLNKATTSPDAFFAVTGKAMAERDARASATSNNMSSPFDPAQTLVEQATPWDDQAQSQSTAAPVDPWSNYLQSF